MLEKSSKPCDTNKEKITDKTQNKRIPWDQYFMAQAVLRRNVNHVRKIFKTMRYEQRKNY